MSSRWSCMGTTPSRKASTSLAVSWGADGVGVFEPVDASGVGLGFGTCGQRVRQESATTQREAAKTGRCIARREVIQLGGSNYSTDRKKNDVTAKKLGTRQAGCSSTSSGA